VSDTYFVLLLDTLSRFHVISNVLEGSKSSLIWGMVATAWLRIICFPYCCLIPKNQIYGTIILLLFCMTETLSLILRE
jgi:hypothetical protein